MKAPRSLIFATAALGIMLSGQAGAKDGYVFRLALTAPDARHDPDGVWSDDDLAFIRQSRKTPVIYTARLATPSGEWLLSQTNGDCNMQGMCTALLILHKPGTAPATMANPQLPLGGTAVLSLNYKKLVTREIDQNGQPLDGSYDVAPIK